MSGTVHLVHAVDTEGPLYEAPHVPFERLREMFGIDHIEPTRDNLRLLKEGRIDLAGREQEVARALSSHRLSTLGSWDQIDAMLDRVMAEDFRDRLLDDSGGGWVYNWFCLDHVGYDSNPRRRDIGHHNVFDHYRARVVADGRGRDEIHWHFHPMSTYREAHRCATHYLRSPELFEILTRKVIERRWFPSVFRAGFQAERPDSHWFLEQFVPFDLTNMAVKDPTTFDASLDFRKGRSGDWRRAPADWSIYQPAHDDYQTPGRCRRYIARCLNVMSRIASIDQAEMDKAFARAAAGESVLVGVCSHDYRDLGPEVAHVRGLIAEARKRFPEANLRFSGALEAFRAVLGLDSKRAPLDLSLTLHPASAEDVPHLEVRTDRGTVFGPQPFLAIKLRGGRFVHDNLDFCTSGTRWWYPFHADTLPLADVESIGVAAADAHGSTCVRTINLAA